MTLLIPLYFYAALGVAAGVVGLHFIVTRQPPSIPLPTARFVPRSAVRVVTVDRPQDLVLLLLRVLAVLLVGLAFARPVLVPGRRPVARIVVADVSRAVGSVDEVRDSARAWLGERDVLVVLDSAARVVRRVAADSAAALGGASGADAGPGLDVGSGRASGPGPLSAGLVSALRVASELKAEADSVELVLVSSFRAEQLDAATHEIRSLWPGRIRLVRVSAREDTAGVEPGVEVRGDPGDGVALALRLSGRGADVRGGGDVRGSADARGGADAGSGEGAGSSKRDGNGAGVRVVRGEATPEDSAWVAGGRRTLVRWPAEGAPPGWRERPRVDTAGAVVAGEAVLVYPLERRWGPDPAGQGRGEGGRVVARWVDGEVAAVEREVGAGCIRDVAIPVPERGDVAFRPSFGHLVRVLAAPCGAGRGAGDALSDADLEALEGEGPLAAREAIPEPEIIATPLVPWLLGAALLLLVLELWLRRGRRSGAGNDGVAEAGEASR